MNDIAHDEIKASLVGLTLGFLGFLLKKRPSAVLHVVFVV